MLAGTQLGAYRVLHQIGAGGMGSVWVAEHAMLGRRAAIKVLHASLSVRPEIVTRFFNEARAATAISDPGIVQVFDFGHHTDGSAYIVMELLEGETLAARLATHGPLPVEFALRIVRQVAGSLGAAHDRGIVHRDLKPENIFLVPDAEITGGERAKILDFGIAKLLGDPSVKTQTAALMGTPTYMSPEQCRGAGQVDQRSDVYALGCVLYTALVGSPPFDAEGVGDIIAMHLREPPPVPSVRSPRISPDIDAIILRCLAKLPAERFESARELALALRPLVERAAAKPTSELMYRAPLTHAVSVQDTTLAGASGSSMAEHVPRPSRAGTRVVIALGALAAIGATVAWQVSRTPSAITASTATPQGSSSLPSAAPADADSRQVVSGSGSESTVPTDRTQVNARQIKALLVSFVAWSRDHAGAACPDARTLDATRQDAWGHTMRVTCTDQPARQIIGVISAGADGVFDSADDIASWQLPRDVTDVVQGSRWTPKVVAPTKPRPPGTPIVPAPPPLTGPTATPPPPESSFSQLQQVKLRIASLLKDAHAAADAGQCDTVRKLGEQIQKLDAEAYRIRVLGDPTLAKCPP